MKSTCGCCAGVEVVTPEPEVNRPGLPALVYRAGTYATFFESMVARLSSFDALRGLTTREPSDPSIALLDAWAIVGDVLTFYQERIANEGYLMTATERHSILELARLVGYKLRPGVSASVYLAFTMAGGFNGTLPAGTRSQSIPGTGETPQFFETSYDLAERDTWNNLSPRLTRPQVITLASDPGTDAATRDTLYFQGISTNLKMGDALLIVLGDDPGLQVPRFVESVNPQADLKRTEVTLQPAPPLSGTAPLDTVTNAVKPFIDEATSIFADSDVATQVATILNQLVTDVGAAQSDQAGADMVRAAIPQIQEQHDIAQSRQFTRLEAWTSDLLFTLRSLVPIVENLDNNSIGSVQTNPLPATLAPSPLANLTAILEPLAKPPSIQPASPQRLVRTVAQVFSPQADTAPRLLATFKPAVAGTIYRAWKGVATPSAQVRVYALRAKAAPFGNNAPQQATIPVGGGGTVGYTEWALADADTHYSLSLDSTYDKILPGTWALIDSPNPKYAQPLIAQVLGVQPVSRADYGMAARVTQLNLDKVWLQIEPGNTPAMTQLRQVTVWAQTELLDLAEEPLDTDVEGDTIELADLYDGLESGRWIIVSGERTDIPNSTGVSASELVMISGVTQGARAPLSAVFPQNYIPFVNVSYTTDANSQGDRLVVGELAGDAVGLSKLNQLIPVPKFVNQQFGDQVQLAPGVWVNAYVPKADDPKGVGERSGSFPDFAGLLVDPGTGLPYPGGVIPSTALGQVFAWRISSAPVHTILTLANKLAYKYDSTSVTIYGNVAQATHGQTVGEVLGDGDASQAFQSFALRQKPLTYVSALTPAGVASTLLVRVNDIERHEVDSLAGLGPTDREYVTQADDSDRTTVVFGNGVHGARVPTGTANVKAVYRYGIGAAGNVQVGQISQLATHPPGAQGVINPLRASGGADRDSADQARRNTPMALMALDRLVGVPDYANFARTFAGIGKASSTRLTDGRRNVVYVTIAGAEDIPIDPSSDLYRNVLAALQQFGDPSLPVQVAVRKLKVLVIGARVKLLADYQWESVEPNVRAAVLATFGFDQRDLGQSAFLSEAIGAIQAVEGVSYVDVETFDAVAEDVTASQLAGLAGTLSLNNAVEADLARIDPTAVDPAKRILPAEVAIVTPDIPDTVILTEIKG
jgi:hypothetical protein